MGLIPDLVAGNLALNSDELQITNIFGTHSDLYFISETLE